MSRMRRYFMPKSFNDLDECVDRGAGYDPMRGLFFLNERDDPMDFIELIYDERVPELIDGAILSANDNVVYVNFMWEISH